MLIPKTISKSQEEKSLQVPKPVSQRETEPPKWLEMIIERYPEQIGTLLETLPVVIAGNPKQIEADTKIALRTLTGFFTLMVIIVSLTSFLAYKGVLGGDAVGFIL